MRPNSTVVAMKRWMRCTVSPLSLIFSFVAAAAPYATSATIAYVQEAVTTSTISDLTATYSAAENAGDLNVVVVAWADSTNTVQSVTDSRGNTYVLAIGPTKSTGNAQQSIYYAKNIAAASAGQNTVTVALTSGSIHNNSPSLYIAEYSGIDTTSPLDVAVGNAGTGTTNTSGSATTTNAHDLLVGANYAQNTTTGPGPGYTERQNPDGDILEDEIVSSTGSYSATAPVDANGYYVMQLAAFKAAVGGSITYVQGGFDDQVTSYSVKATYSAAQASGDLNVAIVTVADSSTSVTSVADSHGNAYHSPSAPR